MASPHPPDTRGHPVDFSVPPLTSSPTCSGVYKKTTTSLKEKMADTNSKRGKTRLCINW